MRVNADEVRAAAEELLTWIDAARPVPTPDLTRVLDVLALVQHLSEPEAAPGSDEDPPETARRDYQETRGRVVACFPDLGMYHAPRGLDDPDELVGDAVDDLADIVIDVDHAIRLWDVVSAHDAIWQLRHDFETHWGEHLRALQWLLHREARPAPSPKTGEPQR